MLTSVPTCPYRPRPHQPLSLLPFPGKESLAELPSDLQETAQHSRGRELASGSGGPGSKPQPPNSLLG